MGSNSTSLMLSITVLLSGAIVAFSDFMYTKLAWREIFSDSRSKTISPPLIEGSLNSF
jgi:hypothetical protein